MSAATTTPNIPGAQRIFATPTNAFDPLMPVSPDSTMARATQPAPATAMAVSGISTRITQPAAFRAVPAERAERNRSSMP